MNRIHRGGARPRRFPIRDPSTFKSVRLLYMRRASPRAAHHGGLLLVAGFNGGRAHVNEELVELPAQILRIFLHVANHKLCFAQRARCRLGGRSGGIGTREG